ncbi:Hypothetical predicted protein [Olea europaea subsp. europaea]|uniref:Uncharacterized protein n=1 Tax=Olea europaea subsp. europaea TaxID=158383 RepID=A0A8S0PCQ2_OLEEU|nr:Hypothetical predicted protein [Olea europaea subsp. europaea]
MEIRINMQVLSELVSAMISSSMDEIMRWFHHQKSDHGVGDKDPLVVEGSDKTEKLSGFQGLRKYCNLICSCKRKLFKHDDIVVFENYKGHVDDVDSSTFMAWFQRGYKPKTKKKFSDDDGRMKPAFVLGSRPIGHMSWFYQLKIQSHL